MGLLWGRHPGSGVPPQALQPLFAPQGMCRVEEQGEEQLVHHLRQKHTATAVALDVEQKSKETEVSPGVGVDKVMIY